MGVDDDEANSSGMQEWDPLLSMDHNTSFNGSACLPSFIVGLSEFYGVNSSNNVTAEQVSSLACFGSKSFSEMMGSFPLYDASHVSNSNASCHLELPSGGENGTEKNLKGKKRKGTTDSGASRPHLPLDKIQKVEAEEKKNMPLELTKKSGTEKDEQKTKSELTQGCNSHRPNSKHAKENSQNVDTGKEDYVHVRAKRGQATNSHSLAERVRREKISERMRLLQDLVPGCNKITGKAMMLDEIINYVQSLQRQVEFLSMKLAAVNPEMNCDIDQILYSQDGRQSAVGFSQGMDVSQPQLHGIIQADIRMCTMPNSGDMLSLSNPHISQVAQIPSVWDHGLQNVVPFGFIPNPPIDSKDLAGSMKIEL